MRKKGKWKCFTCSKQKQDKDTSLECNICNESVGIECSDFNQEVLEYLKTQQVEVTFICKQCKQSLPELRNLVEITRQQQKLNDEIGAHDTRITKLEVDLAEVTSNHNLDTVLLNQINNRLADVEAKLISSETVETIATKCFKEADFPTLKQVERNQLATDKKLNETLATNKKLEETLETQAEQKLRAEKEKSLIVFGIPEDPDVDETDQMKSDFISIQNIYSERVPLECSDLTQVIRIGTIKSDQTRPIKITFHSMQKRHQILKNNKNLKIVGDEFEECNSTYCDETGKTHQHIYVNTDKTKKQIAEEKKLREQPKTRKVEEPNLVIEMGKL